MLDAAWCVSLQQCDCLWHVSVTILSSGCIEDLFSTDEILLLTSDTAMLRSRSRADPMLRISRFWENVKEHLHVIVCLQLHEAVAKWVHNAPKLLSVASTVDFYNALSKESLTRVGCIHSHSLTDLMVNQLAE